jgi:AraC family transcriptional regulator of adaptative response / DNA-3-methyladenine glycosylase II
VRKELGVPPVQLLLTRRLLLAKQLLTETALPVTDVAFASGFSSLRRFNDAFRMRYRMPPTRLRRAALDRNDAAGENDTTSTLRVAYRPPYDWRGLLGFLALRALPGVEWVTTDAYARTVAIGKARGWIRVTRTTGDALALEFTHSLTPVLPTLLRRVRALFDLDARPDVIGGHLGKERRLARAVRRNPGIRVPGAFDGFEIGVRAVLGQQVSVTAATTLGGRFAEAFGEPLATPFAALHRLTPTAMRIATVTPERLAKIGVVAMRARSISALARAQAGGQVHLDGGSAPRHEDAMQRLVALPGIGPWTAEYIAMRAFRWPDAFPKEDLVLRRNLGGLSAADADALSQTWRPWRSYAVMHVWGEAAVTP